MEDYNQDIAELKILLEQSKRPNIRNFIEKEISRLNEKTSNQEESTKTNEPKEQSNEIDKEKAKQDNNDVFDKTLEISKEQVISFEAIKNYSWDQEENDVK